jgi:peptidoglycan hydrolase-like protein with peptidoglycan-binding domain
MRNSLFVVLLASLLLSACGAQLSAEAQGTAMAMAVQLTVLASNPDESEEATATETETATLTATDEPTNTPEPQVTNEPTATASPEPTAFVVPDWPLVRVNDEGPLVFAIQHLLRAHGYNLSVDGKFGLQTRGQVVAFQGDKGLATDGIVGPQTWAKLIQGKTVKEGNTGPAVRAVQYLLHHQHGYNDVAVDGDFGPITDARSRKLQDDYDLTVDGIVGPETWKALVAIEP